jgi:hypothetical protein
VQFRRDVKLAQKRGKDHEIALDWVHNGTGAR